MIKNKNKVLIFTVALLVMFFIPVFFVNAEDTWYKDINVKVTITPVGEDKAVIDTLEPITWLKMVRAKDNKNGTFTIGIYNRNKENTAFEEPGTYPGISPASAQETYFIDKTTGKITYRGKVWHKVGFITAGGYNGTGVTINSSFISTNVKESDFPTLETDGHNNYKWLMFVEKLPDDFDKSELEVKTDTNPIVVSPDVLKSVEGLRSLIVSAKNVEGNDCKDSIIIKLYSDDVEVTDFSTISSDKTYKVVFENVKKEYLNPIDTYRYSIKKETTIQLRPTVKLKDDAEVIKVDTELTQTDKDNIFKLLENVPEGKTVNDFEFKNPEKTENGYKVVVTYKYSEDDVVEINVPVIPYTMAEKTTPVVDEVNKKRGEKVTEGDITGAVSGLPEGATVEVVGELPNGDVAGTSEVEVKITYKDGSSENVNVKVVISNNDADNTDPIVDEVNKKRGEKVTEGDITGAVSGLPEGATVEVVGELPNGDVAGTSEVEVKITYKDGSSENVNVKVVISNNDADNTDPIVDEVNKKRGELLTEKDITGAVSGLPAESVVEVVGNIPSTEVTGRTEVEVKITYKDGSEELVKVTVVVSNSDADNIDPIVSEVNKNSGEKVTDADIIGAISGIPTESKVEIIGVIPDGSVAGRFEVEVRIIYLDGSSELVNVPVVISNVSTGGGAVATPNTDNNLPKTGVDSTILVYIILALVGSSILVYTYKRR